VFAHEGTSMIKRAIEVKGKGGAALVTAVVFVFFLMLFGLAFYRLGETDIDLFEYDEKLSKALYVSEAGIEKVRWMLREVAAANPFDKTFNEANAISIANPTGGDFFPVPGEEDKAYFKVSMIQDASILDPTAKGKVRVRVLGSLDVDADGEAGLTASEDVFTYDPDDVNRRFEAYIGLPGTLGARFGVKGISAAAGAFYRVVPVGLSAEPRLFRTPDGDYVKDRNGDDRFLFFGSGDFGVWDQWGFVFSDPAPTVASGEIDEIELPPGIFDETGEFIDEDDDTKPDYFQDLDLRTYTGAQTFTPSNDPTAGGEGRRVIYVNGDITIDGVDFGYLNDQGDIKNCDWEKAKTDRTFADLAFIANGDITVDRVDCGNVGRLVLVAKNIIFVGDYDTKVNGIAIAYNDITLDGSGCTNGILTRPPPDDDRPVKYAAYFLGSMVAGNQINLQNDGWAVIYDENVINGKMYSTAMLKPTVTYERAEASDFNSSNNWRVTNDSNPEFLHTQGIYTDDERDPPQGDSNDHGDDNDDLPELMRLYTERDQWLPKDHRALREILSLNFPSGVFEDPDISAVTQPDGSQNWDFYDSITFWMALDNFKRTGTDGKITRREARYQIRLRDSNGNTISFPLENFYPESEWGTVRYHHTGSPEEYMNEIRILTPGETTNGETYSSWKRVKISLNKIDPGAALDLRSLVAFDIRYVDMELSWMIDPAKPVRKVIWYDNRYFRYIDENGNWRSIDGKDNQGNLSDDPPAPNDGYYYLYDDAVVPFYWFRWIEDPESSTEIRMREEVLMPTLRIDRLELPGKPLTNDHLNYGFPHCLRFEVTNWKEFKES
jgi:hypothetical protein